MNELIPVINLLSDKDAQTLKILTSELKDAWNKKQIFRTDTEARMSVLNDGDFPTKASKYWQAVREQSSMFEQLVIMSFDLRRNYLKKEKILKKMEETAEEFNKKELQIDLDQVNYFIASSEQVAKDRVRELQMWSDIKTELNDGSFDNQNVNGHQLESYRLMLENRAKMTGNHASPGELMNIAGPLTTILNHTSSLTNKAP
jgi:hypothetical protein